MKKLIPLILTTIGLSAPVSAAVFIGEQVTLFQYYGNNSYQPGPGDEPKIFEWGRGVYEAGEGILLNEPWPFYSIDLIGNRITIDLFDRGFGSDGSLAAYFVQGNGRNGLVLQDTFDRLPSFQSLNLVSSEFDNSPSVVVSDNELIFDFSAAGANLGASATWDVIAVPLPAGLPMLVVAGLGLFVVGRRKKT